MSPKDLFAASPPRAAWHRMFLVPGEPHGFLAAAGKWNKRTKAQRDYYEHVKACAREAGFDLPLCATKHNPLWICTIAIFGSKVHPDPGNVQKGVCDALFHTANCGPNIVTSGDKYTGGSFREPLYVGDFRLFEEPCCIVRITGWEAQRAFERVPCTAFEEAHKQQ